MIKKRILLVFITLLISSVFISFNIQDLKKTAVTKNSPNLIIILADDLGYADVGFNGCKDILTPNIDAIANNGVKFTNGYVTYPVCGPSRAGLLTGRYQDRFGFTTNPTIDPNNIKAGLPLDEEMISEALQKVNYNSAIIGKWHMGTHPVFHPLKRGWDYFFGFLSGGHNYFPEKLTINSFSEIKRAYGWYSTRIMENYNRIDINDYLTDELSDAAVRYIEKQSKEDQQFMVYLSYNAPHMPLQATPKYLDRFPNIIDKKRKTYAAMVSAMDDGIGRVLNTLKKQNIEENTIVVFLSDNGGPVHKNSSNNSPLRGKKSDLYEGGIRVPFAMQWIGEIDKGMIYSNPVSSMDIMATICNLAHVKTKNKLDGVNLMPFLKNGQEGVPHQALFWRKWEQDAMAIRKGDLKLVSNQRKENNPPKLYNLSKDINENKNIKELNKIESDHLLEDWNHWNKDNKDRYFPRLGNDKWWERN
jgi:arylsulfatase A-like enzyme